MTGFFGKVDNWALNGNFYAAFFFSACRNLNIWRFHLFSGIYANMFNVLVLFLWLHPRRLAWEKLLKKAVDCKKTLLFSKITMYTYKKVALNLLFNALFPLFWFCLSAADCSISSANEYNLLSQYSRSLSLDFSFQISQSHIY